MFNNLSDFSFYQFKKYVFGDEITDILWGERK